MKFNLYSISKLMALAAMKFALMRKNILLQYLAPIIGFILMVLSLKPSGKCHSGFQLSQI